MRAATGTPPTSHRGSRSPAGSEAAMRHTAPTPTGSPLPLPAARHAHRRRLAGTVELSPAAIERFNRYLHELNPDAPHVDSDAIASVARWLQLQPREQQQPLLDARLQRLEELRAMRDDSDWTLEPRQAQRIDKLLAYVDDNQDLIPDDLPLFGRLDDALLVELVWPMLAEDIDDYLDFRHYRDELASRGHRTRVRQQDWLLARLEEGALWEQVHRVHASTYVDYGPPTNGLHVV
jgi:hypothetical protein